MSMEVDYDERRPLDLFSDPENDHYTINTVPSWRGPQTPTVMWEDWRPEVVDLYPKYSPSELNFIESFVETASIQSAEGDEMRIGEIRKRREEADLKRLSEKQKAVHALESYSQDETKGYTPTPTEDGSKQITSNDVLQQRNVVSTESSISGSVPTTDKPKKSRKSSTVSTGV